MKFYFDNVILWLNDKSVRTINFLPNKVNVITGDSNTGKTSIFNIIDYCLFANKTKITESIINENTLWYGIRFHVNNKLYTIAREKFNGDVMSKHYYFSSVGDIPKTPVLNNSEEAIKRILDAEFSLSHDTRVSFGGKEIKKDSKISLSYLLLYNKITTNIIENDNDEFIDCFNDNRYRESIPRVFDLAVGIESEENILAQEQVKKIDENLRKIETKKNVIEKKKDIFYDERAEYIKKAKQYGLIKSNLSFEEAIEVLKKVARNYEQFDINESSSDKDKKEAELLLLQRKLSNIIDFEKVFSLYKDNMKNMNESLKPIEYLKQVDSEILKTSIYNDIFENYEMAIKKIKNNLSQKNPITQQVTDLKNEISNEIKKLKDELALLPSNNDSFHSDQERVYFLGKISSMFSLFDDNIKQGTAANNEENITELTEMRNSISVVDISESRDKTKSLLEEVAMKYKQIIAPCLDNLRNYSLFFDYKNKALKFRQTGTSRIENPGSSSNYMFLHLIFSLSLHSVAISNESKYMAPFLLIDQPSRPYYGENNDKKNLEESDTYKMKSVFKLFNQYISDIKDFQVIVVEHVPIDIFANLENVHLVEEFRNGNKLVPEKVYSNKGAHTK